MKKILCYGNQPLLKRIQNYFIFCFEDDFRFKHNLLSLADLPSMSCVDMYISKCSKVDVKQEGQ